MAITWNIQIANVNLNSKRCDISATRTDSESALDPRSYKMRNTPIETAQQRTLALQTIKNLDDAAVSEASSVSTFLDSLEQSAIANLDAWELTR